MVKSRKVLLVNMPDDKCVRDWRAQEYFGAINSPKYVPLGILSLATNLKPGQEAAILDARSKQLTIEETVKRIEEERPDVLGLSANTMRVFAMRELLRRTSAPYKVVGGPHANRHAELILSQGADAVFTGPLADLEFREAVDIQPRGIVKCKTTYANIKFPDRTRVDYKSYYPEKFVFFKTQNRLHMLSSIGCPHNCMFCNNVPTKMQRKTAAAVVDEMQHLYSLGSRSIHFLDDNFNVDESYLHQVMDEMDRRAFQVEWSGRGQVKMSERLAKRMSEHGFKRIHVGIEAVDDNILKYMRKSSSVRQINEFCSTMNKYGIDMLGFFIVGTPIETPEYLLRLPQEIKRLGIKHPHVQILSPTPDSDYYRELLRQGAYKKDVWAEHMANPTADFQIPYPYTEKRLAELRAYVDEIEKEYLLSEK